MKKQINLSKLLGLFLLTICSSELLRANVLDGRSINSTYFSTEVPTFLSTRVEKYYQSSDFSPGRCYNTAQVHSIIDFGFAYMPTIHHIPASAQNFYFAEQQCNWKFNELVSEVYRRAGYFVSESQVSFSLESMSPKLDAILGRFHIEGTMVPQHISAAGKRKVSYGANLKLSECQLANGQNMLLNSPTFNPSDEKNELKDLIYGLRNLAMEKILKCNFEGKTTAILGDVEKTDQNEKTLQRRNFTLTALHDEERLFIDFNQRSPFYSHETGLPIRVFLPNSNSRDLELEKQVLSSATQLIQLITEDYGELLYQMNTSKKTEAERSEIAKAFFERNRDQIATILNTIDKNYSHVALMNKISLLLAFDRMYSAIRQIERRVSNSIYTLDRIVKRTVP